MTTFAFEKSEGWAWFVCPQCDHRTKNPVEMAQWELSGMCPSCGAQGHGPGSPLASRMTDDALDSPVDLNLSVLHGTLAVDGELRTFDVGARLIRWLVTIRVTEPKRRVDVIPVTMWDPPEHLVVEPGRKGDRLWLVGSMQRRYWESPDGRRSRVEVIAEEAIVRRKES